jgi:hypothetical protein
MQTFYCVQRIQWLCSMAAQKLWSLPEIYRKVWQDFQKLCQTCMTFSVSCRRQIDTLLLLLLSVWKMCVHCIVLFYSLTDFERAVFIQWVFLACFFFWSVTARWLHKRLWPQNIQKSPDFQEMLTAIYVINRLQWQDWVLKTCHVYL